MKNVLLVAICVVLCAGAAQGAIDDYVAYWQFEEGDGTTYGSADSSANGYDWTDTAGRNNVTGIVGNNASKHDHTSALTFRGQPVTGAPKIANADDLTVSMWILGPPDPPGAPDDFVSELFAIWDEDGAGNRKFYIGWMNSNGRLATGISQIGSGASEDHNSLDTSTLMFDEDDGWHHVVFKIALDDSGDDDWFVYYTPVGAADVVLAGSWNGTKTALFDATGGVMTCGSSQEMTALEYTGRIDELVVYDRALGLSEIEELFELGKAGQAIPEPATLAVLLTGLVLSCCRRKK